MDINSWLHQTSVLYEHMPKDVKDMLQCVVTFHNWQDGDGDATKLAQLLCSMATTDIILKDDLLSLVREAPYLSPLIFTLPKPCSTSEVFTAICMELHKLQQCEVIDMLVDRCKSALTKEGYPGVEKS